MASSEKEIVLLIHGTHDWQENDYFLNKNDSDKVSSDKPREANWWQLNSEFVNRLKHHFPKDIEVEAFKWPKGRNSERDRLLGAFTLAKRLKEFETHNQPYHIIAYSHGGTVFWKAADILAEESILLGNSYLNNLKSVTSVGSPFLRSNKAPIIWLEYAQSILRFGFSICVLFAICSLLLIIPLTWDSWVNHVFVQGVFITFICLLFTGMLIFTYSETNLYRFLGRDDLLRQYSTNNIRGRYLCICSKEDEAVLGLKKTFNDIPKPKLFALRSLQKSFNREEIPIDIPRYFDVLLGVLWNILAFALNLGLKQYLRSANRRVLQGHDFLIGSYSEVNHLPSKAFKEGFLPHVIEAELSLSAEKNLLEVILEFRRDVLRFEATISDVFQSNKWFSQANLRALVHTQYFHSAEVRELIFKNIFDNLEENSNNLQSIHLSNDLNEWYVGWFKNNGTREGMELEIYRELYLAETSWLSKKYRIWRMKRGYSLTLTFGPLRFEV